MKFFLKEYNPMRELTNRFAVTAPSVDVAVDKLERLYSGNTYKQCSGDTLGGMLKYREITVK